MPFEFGLDARRKKIAEGALASVIDPEIIGEAHLVYVSDEMPGITRKKAGEGFIYVSPDGSRIRDKKVLERIRSLVIPPAYSHVWICPLENGHLQATGRDARGRKHYRYHSRWLEESARNKFEHVLRFGTTLPRIRDRVDHDLAKHGLPREKVLATVVWFLESSLIRVGNEEYARDNKSYGLTTMRMRHCKVEGSVVKFQFVGKRGVKHDIKLVDRRMARIVKRIQELPGQDLFQYVGDSGERHSVTSADVNDYIKEIAEEEFTAKDFRTWAATVSALSELSSLCELSGRKAKSAVSAVMKAVARQLGNTPAVCRKSYVHPGLVTAYLDGSLASFLQKRLEGKACEALSEIEDVAIEFLRQCG